MKIVTVAFDYDSAGRYGRLAQVLEQSVKENCPSAEFELISIPAPKVLSHKRCYESNTVKLEVWLKKLKEYQGDMVFLDCDMMVLGDLSPIFAEPNFDVAYTIRDGRYSNKLPMNGGAVFVRYTPAGVDFIEKWNKVNADMYADILKTGGRNGHIYYRQRFAGMNQAAFGYLTTSGKVKFNARLKQLPCSIWNACIEHWRGVNASTKIVHVKGGLRSAVLGLTPTNLIPVDSRLCVSLWRGFAEKIGIRTGDNKNVTLTQPVVLARKKQDGIPLLQRRRSRYLRRYV